MYNLTVQDMFLVQYYILITRIYMHNSNGSESECDTFEPPTVKVTSEVRLTVRNVLDLLFHLGNDNLLFMTNRPRSTCHTCRG